MYKGRTIISVLESRGMYSQSRFHNTPKLPKETDDAYERRTWRERVHSTEEGNIFIPGIAFKNCLSEAALYLGMKIPGQKQKNYTKHFVAGILVLDNLVLPIKKDEIDGEWYHVPSDGKRGGTKRVSKCFPVIRSWSGKLSVTVLDDIITLEVFKKHLVEAGLFIGIGRFRPINNGMYGRFQVGDVVEERIEER